MVHAERAACQQFSSRARPPYFHRGSFTRGSPLSAALLRDPRPLVLPACRRADNRNDRRELDNSPYVQSLLALRFRPPRMHQPLLQVKARSLLESFVIWARVLRPSTENLIIPTLSLRPNNSSSFISYVFCQAFACNTLKRKDRSIL